MKLSQLSAPVVRQFEDRLRRGEPAPGAAEGAERSPAMVQKIRSSLSSIISDAMERGYVSRNVVRELRSGRKRGVERRADRRQRGKYKLGVHIPEPKEMSRFLAVLEGRWKPILQTAVFSPVYGLRSFVGCAGKTSISSNASCTSGSVLTATTRWVGRSRKRESAQFR